MNSYFLKRVIILLIYNKRKLYKEYLFFLIKEALKHKIFEKYSDSFQEDLKPYIEILNLFVQSYLVGGDYLSYQDQLSKEAKELLNEIIEEEKYLEIQDKLISSKDEEYLLNFIKNYFTEDLIDTLLIEFNNSKTNEKEINYEKVLNNISSYYSKILEVNSNNQELRIDNDSYSIITKMINTIGITENISTTGFSHLDEYLINKGIDAGEICIFAAPPGWGKSITLLNVFLKNLELGKNVVLISLENSIAITIIRMLSNLLNISQNELKDNKELALEFLKQFLDKINKNKLGIPILKHFPSGASIEEIEEYLKSLNPKPDTIIVDYLGEIKAPSYMRNEHHRLQVAEIVRTLRRIGDNLGAAVFTASQLNREGQMSIEKADQTNIANSWDQVAIADLLIVFRQTIEDSVSNTLRMYIAKNRIGQDSKEVLCKIDYAKAQIVSVGSLDVSKVNPKKNNKNGFSDSNEWGL